MQNSFSNQLNVEPTFVADGCHSSGDKSKGTKIVKTNFLHIHSFCKVVTSLSFSFAIVGDKVKLKLVP